MDMENKVTISIYRERKAIGFDSSIRIFLDGQQLGSLKNGEELNYTLEYGRHKIEAKMNDKSISEEVNVNSSNNGVEVVVTAKAGMFSAKPHIKAIIYR